MFVVIAVYVGDSERFSYLGQRLWLHIDSRNAGL